MCAHGHDSCLAGSEIATENGLDAVCAADHEVSRKAEERDLPPVGRNCTLEASSITNAATGRRRDQGGGVTRQIPYEDVEVVVVVARDRVVRQGREDDVATVG